MDIFSGANIIGLFVKLFGIVLGFLYVFFAWVMIRQIESLERTLSVSDDGLLITLARVQLVLALVIVLFALFIL